MAVSTSGPFFIRSQLGAYAAVFWRALIGGALCLLVAAARGVLRWPRLREHMGAIALGALLFSVHLQLWVRAFALTDYASNLLLLVMQPVTAAVLCRWMGEPLPRGARASLLLAAVGLALVAGSDVTLGPQALLGDLLSVLSGVVMALHFVVARRARAALPIDVYFGVLLTGAALVALPVAAFADELGPYSAVTWGWLIALVVIPTLLGHGLMNIATRRVPLFAVNMAIVVEPAFAIALGAVMFGARVNGLQALGGVVLTSSVLVILLPSAQPAAPPLAADHVQADAVARLRNATLE